MVRVPLNSHSHSCTRCQKISFTIGNQNDLRTITIGSCIRSFSRRIQNQTIRLSFQIHSTKLRRTIIGSCKFYIKIASSRVRNFVGIYPEQRPTTGLVTTIHFTVDYGDSARHRTRKKVGVDTGKIRTVARTVRFRCIRYRTKPRERVLMFDSPHIDIFIFQIGRCIKYTQIDRTSQFYRSLSRTRTDIGMIQCIYSILFSM